MSEDKKSEEISPCELAILEIVRVAQQVAHAEGYDVGYDRGWRACSTAMEPRP